MRATARRKVLAVRLTDSEMLGLDRDARDQRQTRSSIVRRALARLLKRVRRRGRSGK